MLYKYRILYNNNCENILFLMNNMEGELCLPQEDPGGKQHPSPREQSGEALEEGMSSTSFTDQQVMSLQSFCRTISGSLRNIPAEHQKFLYECFRKPFRNFYITGFSPHRVAIIINKLLVGIFYNQSCFVLDMETVRKSAELGLIHIVCKPNMLPSVLSQLNHPRNLHFTGFCHHTKVKYIDNIILSETFYNRSYFAMVVELDRKSVELVCIKKEDEEQEDPPIHLVENRVPNCQLFNFSNINSNCLGEKWQRLFQDRTKHSRLHKSKKISGAIACLFENDILIKSFYEAKPIYKKRRKENNIHYEQLLCTKINQYLQEHNEASKGGKMEIFLYIPKSPCFKRENGTIKPCFFLLLESTSLWQKKFNCCTYVGFTDYFGPLGSRVLDKIPKSKILSINSIFHPYAEKSENVCVKLNWKQIHEKITEMMEQKKFQNIPNLNTDFPKCRENLCNLAKRELKFKQHSDSGKEFIASSGFDSTIIDEIREALCEIWVEEVENMRLGFIKEKLIADLNNKFAEAFLKHQRFSSRDDSLQFTYSTKIQ